jgi:hypothetical protein
LAIYPGLEEGTFDISVVVVAVLDVVVGIAEAYFLFNNSR